jgi:Cu(I)/Ag(I) efflux system periplasmic protein CusF
MKHISTACVAAAATALLTLSGAAFAQATMDHSQMPMASTATATPAMTDGVVRKIDKDSGKLTIKHGDIKHMDMPGMTMVFTVKDKSLLDTVQVGQKVQFMVVHENSQMVVTDIRPAK